MLGLATALAFTLMACFPLALPSQREIFSFHVIIDITRSMNVADYHVGASPLSRLEAVKAALRQTLTVLPCGSRVGVGVFTERRPFVLFEPIEVCEGFAAIDAALGQLDWRMAWEADSRIADAFRNSLELVRDTDDSLVFITDGQEAPPLNPRYRPDLSGFAGKAKGIVIGVGGLAFSAIPKFDEQGKQIGIYGADEVMQRSTFGMPELPPDAVEGYHARNNPFGNAASGGTEHLSSLKEDYLMQLASEAGLAYRRLQEPESLSQALTLSMLATRQASSVDLRPIAAALATAALAFVYFPSWRTIRAHGVRAGLRLTRIHSTQQKGVHSR